MYKIESSFTHNNHECVVIFTSMGYRCGYIAVEQTSPLFGLDYMDKIISDELLQNLMTQKKGKRSPISVLCWNGETVSPEILFDVHGGITYSNDKNCYPVTKDRYLWWFGFDCAHLGDAKDNMQLIKYFPKQAMKLLEFGSFFGDSGTIKSKDFIINECKNLVEQITIVEQILLNVHA